MQRRKRLALIALPVYLLFAQFIVKARVSTHWENFSSSDACITKKMDTYESKRSCRADHNAGDIDGSELLVVDTEKRPLASYRSEDVLTLSSIHTHISANQQAPPGIAIFPHATFLPTYVGSIFQLC